jgi:hypothetical protein
LARALDRAPGVRTVSFDSGGGWVREGRLLAGVISQRGLATNVDVECSSACTLAFLAGRERTLGPGALIGFHQVRLVGQSDDARALDVAQTEAMYRSAGLPTDFLDKVMATPPDQMWYPTPAELLTAKVITGRTSLNESRAEFARASVRARSEASAKGFPSSDGGLTAMLDCKVHQYVEWLSTTECSYRYDDPSKSLDEHLEDQKACLDRAGSAAKLRQIGAACATVTALFKP